jgi:hypothetical protein
MLNEFTAIPRMLTPIVCIFLCVAHQGVSAQTIDLLNGQNIANGTVIANGSTVNVEGGTIGLGVDLSNGVLNINSGNVAIGATGIPTGFTNSNNVVTLNGGAVGGFFQLFDQSELTINGGTIESFGVFDGSRVTINGGTVTRFPDIFSAGVVDIHGGDIFSIRAFSGSTVNLFGTSFALDGEPIENLIPNQQFEISDRNVTLTGVLEDGSSIETSLNTNFGGFFSSEPDGAAAGATVTVTMVAAVGDLNADGVVDAGDINLFPDQLGLAGTDPDFDSAFDFNGDGQITLADHNLLITEFVQTSNGLTGTFIGDANLDGSVTVLGDAFTLISNLGSTDLTGWPEGDFNADQRVTVLGDAFLLVANLGSSNEAN